MAHSQFDAGNKGIIKAEKTFHAPGKAKQVGLLTLRDLIFFDFSATEATDRMKYATRPKNFWERPTNT